jgi:hypothetical protein
VSARIEYGITVLDQTYDAEVVILYVIRELKVFKVVSNWVSFVLLCSLAWHSNQLMVRLAGVIFSSLDLIHDQTEKVKTVTPDDEYG